MRWRVSVDPSRRGARIPATWVCLLLVVLAASPPARGQEESGFTIEKVFYGTGWVADPSTGVRRHISLVNLTLNRSEAFPDGGRFDTFSQIFTEFSIPTNASGPADGPALRIRFSYYVDARCQGLSVDLCPLGANATAISQDTLDLETERIFEYRDTNGNGAYDVGETIERELNLARPEAPIALLWSSAADGTTLWLPYTWTVTSEDAHIDMGALFAGDPLLEELSHFRISVGESGSWNLTVYSYFFLRDSTFKGIPLTPSQLKIDIALANYLGYLGSDTALALELRLTSFGHRIELNESGVSERLYTSSEAAVAFFSWSRNATVDGRSLPVGSTVVATDESEAVVYLSYPQGEGIGHDPVLGFVAPRAGGTIRPDLPVAVGDLVIPLVLGSAFAGVAAFIVLRERRRRGTT